LVRRASACGAPSRGVRRARFAGAFCRLSAPRAPGMRGRGGDRRHREPARSRASAGHRSAVAPRASERAVESSATAFDPARHGVRARRGGRTATRGSHAHRGRRGRPALREKLTADSQQTRRDETRRDERDLESCQLSAVSCPASSMASPQCWPCPTSTTSGTSSVKADSIASLIRARLGDALVRDLEHELVVHGQESCRAPGTTSPSRARSSPASGCPRPYPGWSVLRDALGLEAEARLAELRFGRKRRRRGSCAPLAGARALDRLVHEVAHPDEALEVRVHEAARFFASDALLAREPRLPIP